MHSLPIHSSTFSSSYWYNFLNCSDLIVSLYWGLKLFDSVWNRPSNVLHVSFSSVINVSKYWRPFLPNQFLTIANLSACRVLYTDKTLLTSNLNVFSSLYLSSAFQSKVSCFMAGLSILGPDMSCVLSAQAPATVWIATLVASATALVITSFIICSDALTYFLYLTFFDILNQLFYSWHHVMRLCLIMMIMLGVLIRLLFILSVW